ncbi:hypothetical protein CEE37_14725 [candidate division LCP-89 bacterium B3_LCP]|uniref:histidine kinase n=1 Tax=candidate division LCP-89 bacterium B3_LCP TaxID=2012998 RepID=A0A532UPG7_UNCL8|nr:MAG: hypothetical protein CEE37_14725 [candidate division LCP-89 bacterium B3_LCP]
MISASSMVEENITIILRRIQFFDDLTTEELELVAGLVKRQTYDKDDIVFKQGDPAEAFYVIESGRIEIIMETFEKPEVIASLGRSGDFFGEIALIEDNQRLATVKAVIPASLLIIFRSDFTELVSCYPSIQERVTRALTHNMRQSDSHFVEAIIQKNKQLADALTNLKAAQDELLRKERLSMVGRLASGIIHDLKKPMTCISGYAQLLKVSNIKEEKRVLYADKITQEIQRLVNMINEILQFSRGEQQITLTKVDIKTWIREEEEYFCQGFSNASINFKKNLKYDGSIYIDVDKFKSVFYNITANATAAMPHGGTFTLKTSLDKDKVRFDFIDDGIGMGDEASERVFDDFFSQSKDGTGLGMAIVKRIIEAHQGTISVQSELGIGTEFTIHLPLENK